MDKPLPRARISFNIDMRGMGAFGGVTATEHGFFEGVMKMF